MSDASLILVGGVLLGAGIWAALLADRVRVPGLLLFLGLGMLVGSDGIGGVDFDDYELTRTLGTIGLVLILFEGGLTAGWGEIRPVLGTAVALATIGTALTAAITGVVAIWLFDLDTLDGLIVGSAVAATDSAAIFAVLRGSTLRRRVARTLEGESGMNDPVALLLVTGFIEWIQQPDYGAIDMAGLFASKLALGVVFGMLLGYLARRAFRAVDLPTPGLYPVASIATAALSYGIAESLGGSGFLAVYLAALVLGTGALPAKQTVVAFHQGVSWVAQIALFFLLGLLVFPSGLDDVAGKGLLLAAVLMFVARPLAATVSSLPARFELRERLMLGWAGLRGAIPIWLATFPVIAGVTSGPAIFDIVFFVVVSSTLVQGASIEPLARWLGVTASEPSLPQPLVEIGRIRRLGGEVLAWRVPPGAAISGHPVKELGLPRESVVNVIVRGERALPPRGSTEIEERDELHIFVSEDLLPEVERLAERWTSGPIGEPEPPPLPPRAAPLVFSVRPASALDGDPRRPRGVGGIAVRSRLRSRRDSPGALVSLADGRFAITGASHVALGGRRDLAHWCERRAARPGIDGPERAWWQEVAGALIATGSD